MSREQTEAMTFTNQQNAITVNTVGELIRELSLLPPELPVRHPYSRGLDLTFWNREREDVTIVVMPGKTYAEK
jgi:hypothetical protein